jgi:long-subunit fatty acid transport protein
MMRQGWTLVATRGLTAWVVTVWCSTVLADGVIRDGLGARSSGRAGTNIAFADTGVIIYDNPAGMSNVDGNGLAEAGFDILFTDLTYSDADNPVPIDAADNPFPAGQVSIIKKSCDGRFAYGLGFFAPAGFSSKYTMEGPAPLVGPQQYKSLGMMMKLLPGISYQATERLSIGATLGVGINHMEVEGPYFLQSPGTLQGTPLILDMQATGVAPVWSVGLQYKATERTTIGLSYIAETHFRNHGDSVMQIPMVGVNEYQTQLNINWPQSLGLGLKHQLFPKLTVAADIIWYDWSEAKENYNAIFSDPTNPIVGVLAPTLNENFPMRWRDSVSYRFGSEYQICNCRTLRAGYAYHRNPIPDETLTPWIQATLEHAASLGYGWKFNRDWSLDAAYQYNWGNDREVGTSAIIGGDFSNSTVETEAHWLYFSALRRF